MRLLRITFSSILILLLANTNLLGQKGKAVYTEDILKGTKVLGTQSFKLVGNSSIHLAEINKKGSSLVTVKPFYVGEDGEVKLLRTFTKNKDAEIVGAYSNDAVISLSVFNEYGSELAITSIDLNTNEVSFSKKATLKETDFVISRDDGLVILDYNKSKKSIHVLSCMADNKIAVKSYATSQRHERAGLKYLNSEIADIVDLQEYSKYGSINTSKIYDQKDDGILVLTGSTRRGISHYRLFEDSLKTKILMNIIPYQSVDYKRVNANYMKGNFYVIKTTADKKVFSFDIYNATSNELIKSISRQDLLDIGIKEDKLDQVIRKSGKNNFSPSVALLETVEGNVNVKISAQNQTIYSYYNDLWWHNWHFQQFQQFNQFNQLQNFKGPFTPSPDWYEQSFDLMGLSEDTPQIRFLLKKDYSIALKTEKSILKRKNYESIRDQYKTYEKTTRHATGAFLDNEARYIFYNKPEKKLIIDKQAL